MNGSTTPKAQLYTLLLQPRLDLGPLALPPDTFSEYLLQQLINRRHEHKLDILLHRLWQIRLDILLVPLREDHPV